MSDREENKDMLLARGMSEEEVENFLTPGNKVMHIELLLPPTTLIDTLRALARISILPGPVKVRFAIIENRYKQFVEIAQCASGREVVDATRKPGDLLN